MSLALEKFNLLIMSIHSDFDGNPDFPEILSGFDKFANFTRYLNIFGILLLGVGYGIGKYLTVEPEILYYLDGGVALILLCNFFFTYFYRTMLRLTGEPNH